MQSFAEGIDGSFEKAAAGARDIGALLAETSQSTGGMIDRQLAGIRGNIEQESETMAAAVRSACAQANAELETILGQTTERFQSAATELRGMSREIQHELELDARGFASWRGRAAAGDGTSGGHHAAGRCRSDQGPGRVE